MSDLEDAVTAMTTGIKLAKAAADYLHQAHASDDDPIEIDDEGWMHGRAIDLVPSPKKQPLATPDGDVDGVVAHYTDTRGAGALNLARRIASQGGRAASWHVCIDAKGSIAQSVSFKAGSWHAGGDSAAVFNRDPASGLWMPVPAAGRGRVKGWSANSWAVGIEFENVGEVRQLGGEWLGWPFRHDVKDKDGSIVRPAAVPADEVHVESPGRGHHLFTEPQLVAGKRVYGALVRRYALKRANCLWGHNLIDPARRTDPGPLYMGPKMDGHGGHLQAILDAVYDLRVP